MHPTKNTMKTMKTVYQTQKSIGAKAPKRETTSVKTQVPREKGLGNFFRGEFPPKKKEWV